MEREVWWGQFSHGPYSTQYIVTRTFQTKWIVTFSITNRKSPRERRKMIWQDTAESGIDIWVHTDYNVTTTEHTNCICKETVAILLTGKHTLSLTHGGLGKQSGNMADVMDFGRALCHVGFIVSSETFLHNKNCNNKKWLCFNNWKPQWLRVPCVGI